MRFCFGKAYAPDESAKYEAFLSAEVMVFDLADDGVRSGRILILVWRRHGGIESTPFFHVYYHDGCFNGYGAGDVHGQFKCHP
jgi:hypothetical protein